MQYRLSARVTISLYTLVEANSKEEAIEIAKGRDNMQFTQANFGDEEEEWCTDELDGEPFNVRVVD